MSKPFEAPPASPEVWSEALQISSFDVDFKQRASLEALCRYFLNAAWNHAEALGVGYNHLAGRNQLWVLARLLIQVHRYPRWGEQVTLHTWPQGARTIYALRHFEIVDVAGKQLVGGASSWLILDVHTRRPQRAEKLLASLTVVPHRRAIANDPEKLPGTENTVPALTALARYSDVDVNRHVNSARYVSWVLDSFPLEFHTRHAATLLEMNYVAETLAGETLAVRSEETLPGEFHHGIAKLDGAEVCRARTRWQPEPA